MKHTKGEWERVGYPDERVKESGTDICILNPHRGVNEAHANATLIAAAPELLAFALKFSEQLASGEIEILQAKKGSEKVVSDMVTLNIEAINKAKS